MISRNVDDNNEINREFFMIEIDKLPGGNVKLSQGWSKAGSSSSSQFSTLHLIL